MNNVFVSLWQGEFYSAVSPSEPPFSPHYFKLPWQADYMLSVGMSDFCVNSATYAYLKSGVLSINITDGMVRISSEKSSVSSSYY